MGLDVDLEALGWDAGFAEAFAPFAAEGWRPARVSLEHNHIYRVLTPEGEALAEVAGKLKHEAAGRRDLPAVGDWAAVRGQASDRRATIQALLPRRSRFSRKVAGHRTDEQVVAANIDRVLVVMGLDEEFNLRRLERYLMMAREGSVDPVVVLNKADLCDAGTRAERVADVVSVAADAPVHVLSSRTGEGMDALGTYLTRGRTLALLGSSGVGKSTIVNHLVGRDMQRTHEVRAGDSKGRQTTRHRQMIVLPGGGLIIDTPGMREMQLWEGSETLPETFDDVASIGAECRFRDCRHETEPGCAVRQAAVDGRLTQARLDSYVKLRREVEAFNMRHDEVARRENNRVVRSIHRSARNFKPRE